MSSETPRRPALPSRRAILRWGVGGGLLLGAGAWLAGRPPGSPAPVPDPTRLSVLGAGEAAVFAAAAARLLDPGDVPGAAAADTAAAVLFLDRFLDGAPPAVQDELRALLTAFDRLGPALAASWGRFTSLPPARQDRVLERWEAGPRPLRMGFQALKQLAFMAHYAREESWPLLGYDGPLVEPGWRGGETGWFDPSWLAPEGDPLVDSGGRRRRP